MTGSLVKVANLLVLLATLSALSRCLLAQDYDALEVMDKSPEELLELRGFHSETHFARTSDGYYLHVVRVVNPLVGASGLGLKRPVIFNHGLMMSSTMWLINSRGVRPADERCSQADGQTLMQNLTSFISGPMMLANYGYDVWLMSMRGTDWSLGHEWLSAQDEAFWNYSLDDFALGDVPAVVDYVLAKTGAPKLAYVGHSQATFSVFGLLASRPHYAELIEPVVAIAPVAFLEHIGRPAAFLIRENLRRAEVRAEGPFPADARNTRRSISENCGNKANSLARAPCRLLYSLISGKGRDLLTGHWNHMPFYSSLKVLRHFNQLIRLKRFMSFDYGPQRNRRLYGLASAPSYSIANITSRSLCLFSGKSDALSSPRDVQHFVDELTVPLFSNIFVNKNFNHFDLIFDIQAGELVFFPMLKIMEHFEARSRSIC